jgi:aryl-alcohol dehydrogenase-like predicted oxidoreductase
MKRRSFLKGTVAASAALGCFPATLSGVPRDRSGNALERRTLGRTGEMLSIIGFGGIVVKDATPAESAARVREAIDAGVNYFDVAPTYGDAEEKLGPALEPYRKDVFLACKTTERQRAKAMAELDRSLRRMRTDHFDLYQLHAITTLDEVEMIFGPGGAMESFAEARRAGKTRFLGFSAHSVEAALALMDRFEFDTLLFPLNFATWHAGNFGPSVLAKAREKQMGILALKAMAWRSWAANANRSEFPKCWYQPLSKPADAELGLKFTLSHPVTAAIPPGDENLFRLAVRLAARFSPLTETEAEHLKVMARDGQPIFRH